MPLHGTVAHITTVHPRTDARIRLKEVATLAKSLDCRVSFFVQDGLGAEMVPGGYNIIDTGPRLSRLSRMTKGAVRMVQSVLRYNPKIVHFHDPEFLPWAIVLRILGKRIVYDVHEDVPRQVLHNTSLKPYIRQLVSPFISFAEWLSGKLFNAIVAATPEIAARFPSNKTIVISNYPLLEEFESPGARPMAQRDHSFAYIGGLSRIRGLFAMAQAMEHLNDDAIVLRLAGEFVTEREREEFEASKGVAFIRYEGLVGRDEVGNILSEVRAGLVTLMPIRNYIEARPVKLFEYMAAGLPVIASDFPRWREIVAENRCGILVDPADPKEIAAAMRWIIQHPSEAQEMGMRGRHAVIQHYNWNPEADRLVALYQNLLK